MGASCSATRNRWCGPTHPASARSSWGIFSRKRPCANCASAAPSVSPGDQRGQDLPSGFTQDIGGHRGQLDVGTFQGLLQPIGRRGPLPDQARPVTGQFPHLPLRPVGNEAAAEQPVPQQLGQPLAVADVRLAPGHGLDVAGIDQEQGELLLQQVPDRLPIDAGALHGDVGHLVRGQPVRQRQDVRRSWSRRPESSCCGVPSGPVITTQATTSRLCTSTPQQRG